MSKHPKRFLATGVIAMAALVVAATKVVEPTLAHIGKLPTQQTLLSSGQTIEPETFAFKGRPADIALHPGGQLFAMSVMSQVDDFVKSQLVLATPTGIVDGSSVKMGHHPAFHGLVWSPDGSRLICATGERYDDTYLGKPTTDGVLEIFRYEDGKLVHDQDVRLDVQGEAANPVPAGMSFSKDGSKLYVACVDLNAILELDGHTYQRLRKLPVGMLPYTAKLSEDESQLIVSNWGGRRPADTDTLSQTGISKIAVNKSGSAASGTVSIIRLSDGTTTNIEVGMHPSDIAVRGSKAYVANTMSDSISTIDLAAQKLEQTDPLTWQSKKLLGSMPTALTFHGDNLLLCDGGDNALAEFDLAAHRVLGYRPAGYFPIGVVLQGNKAIVANSKGNGSLARTRYGGPGNVHEFEGTVRVVDLGADLAKGTEVVAADNRWDRDMSLPDLPPYHGAIKHVLYIIKENKTYDQIYGDLEKGNGDPKLCILGEKVMPNHRALAREFTLFDNAYVSGTNSGDGHQWSTQGLADDYVEKFYVGYSRTYNDDGNCAMSLSNFGTLWDAAAAKHLSIRDYGEFVVADDAKFAPYRPKDWFEAWEDRKLATHKFSYIPHTRVAGLAPYVHPTVHYWPLIQSDQSRADEYIKDLTSRIANNTVPQLMIMSLPCDHSEGSDPDYPEPKSMMADNDLALGRVVDAVSHSAIWKDTCIFVIEDDSQSGLDHVDGHRTPYLVISPYTKRHAVDHHFYTTNSMLRSIELMLGFGPMNRLDALADPITTCFDTKPDLTPYDVRPNNIPLDAPNPGRKGTAMTPEDRQWLALTKSMDWSHPDGPDPDKLDRIIWHSIRGNQPYPSVKVIPRDRDGD